jgi:hypothetical protein
MHLVNEKYSFKDLVKLNGKISLATQDPVLFFSKNFKIKSNFNNSGYSREQSEKM